MGDSTSFQRVQKSINLEGAFNLLVVYIVWGSTYLAIRVAVREGAGFPPFTLGAMRVFVAGILLLVLAKLRRERIKLNLDEVTPLFVSGILLWLGGNGLVNWAEQRADSSLSALMISAVPIWVALIEAILDRRLPSFKLVASLAIGFMGIGVLITPTMSSGGSADVLSILALLLAGLSWGSGTIYQSRKSMPFSPMVSSAYQHIFGGFGFLVIIFILGEPLPSPKLESWFAWGYLVVFGSMFAFTAFVRVLKILPTRIVVTYAYINPVIAVFLGWLILRESITIWMIIGTALVLLGVAGVYSERFIGPNEH